MLERRDKYVNVCDTVKLLGGGGGILQCNGEKLEEAEDLKCVFLIFCVLETK